MPEDLTRCPARCGALTLQEIAEPSGVKDCEHWHEILRVLLGSGVASDQSAQILVVRNAGRPVGDSDLQSILCNVPAVTFGP